jgi:hypothetical protein
VSTHQWARRRLVNDNGRPMPLSRLITGSDPPAYQTVNVQAFSRGLVVATDQRGRVEVRTIGVQMLGDEIIEILTDEIAAASWPAPPIRNDRVTWDGLSKTVQAAKPVYDATLLIGWSLTVRS